MRSTYEKEVKKKTKVLNSHQNGSGGTNETFVTEGPITSRANDLHSHTPGHSRKKDALNSTVTFDSRGPFDSSGFFSTRNGGPALFPPPSQSKVSTRPSLVHSNTVNLAT